jgi:hypothetical protein
MGLFLLPDLAQRLQQFLEAGLGGFPGPFFRGHDRLRLRDGDFRFFHGRFLRLR